MKDFDVLRELPELAPFPGQVDAALALVQSRRRRSAVRTASTACGLAVAALLLTAKSPSTSLLEPTREGVVQTATAVPSPAGHGGETDRAAGPRFATRVGGTDRLAGEDDPTESPELSASPVAPSTGPTIRPREDMVRERYSNITNPMHVSGGRRGCGPMAGTNTECSTVNYSAGEESVLLTVTLCNGTEDRVVTFPTGQESDVVVYDSKDVEVWRWARGQEFPAGPHDVVLGPQECLAWTTPWDYGDESGTRVPPGRYRVMMPILSDPMRNMGTSVTVA